MGQKINPYGFRLGVTTDWKARWFARGDDYKGYLHEDIKIREFLAEELPHAGISRVEIERTRDRIRIDIHTARPGIVIGRRGSEVEHIRKVIQKMTGATEVRVDALEVKIPQLEAVLVAQNTAEQIAGRIAFRRAMRRAVGDAMRYGAKGVKVQCSGRLGGAEMARTEVYRDGQVPLTTLRADIDYGLYEARTKYGRIGCKVWIYKGEILPTREEEKIREAARERVRRRQRRRQRTDEGEQAAQAAPSDEAEPAPADEPEGAPVAPSSGAGSSEGSDSEEGSAREPSGDRGTES